MRLVVADTGPLNYLLLIDEIGLLEKLFDKIFVPGAVAAELCHPRAPAAVRAWAVRAPTWIEIQSASLVLDDPAWRALDTGEREAIALARSIGADLLLIDDRSGAKVALHHGFEVVGTLGLLALGARRGLIDLPMAVNRLKNTNFRYRPAILDALLSRYRG